LREGKLARMPPGFTNCFIWFLNFLSSNFCGQLARTRQQPVCSHYQPAADTLMVLAGTVYWLGETVVEFQAVEVSTIIMPRENKKKKHKQKQE